MVLRWRTLMAVLASAALAACGGGGGGGSCTPNVSIGGSSSSCSSSATANYSVELVADSSQMVADGKSTVTFTARVKDANNAAVSGQTVTFSANAGMLSAASATTDSTGTAQVILSNTDRTNRTITVTATLGATTTAASVQVTGTTLAFGGSVSAIAGRSSSMSVTLRDGGNSPIAQTTIKLTSSAGSTLPSTVTTDAAGLATFSYTPTKAGPDTLTAEAMGATANMAVTVSSVDLSITSPAAGTSIAVNTGCQQITATLNNAAGPVLFSINRGQIYTSSGCSGTGSSASYVGLTGNTASVWVKSSNVGAATVLAEASGGSATLGVNFIATTPSTIDVQSNPSSMAAGQTSTVTAIVRDATGNVVANQSVYFSAPNGGGVVGPQTAVTDGSGVATTTFTADAVSSGNGQVEIDASIPAFPTATMTPAYITVGGQAIRVAIGSDNTVYDLTIQLQYQQQFVVKVTDTNGSPVANQTVSVSLAELAYKKGTWVYDANRSPFKWYLDANNYPVTCQTEDTNLDGRFDNGEIDFNGNGKLDPDGATSILATSGGSASKSITMTTDSSGEAYLWVNYPKDHAGWVQYQLTATVTVSGTNNKATRAGWLNVPSDPLKQDANPPFKASPFGTVLDCKSPY